MKKKAIIMICVVVAWGLVSCGKSYKEQQRLSQEQRRELARQDSAALKIATLPTLDCLPLFVATDDSLFRQFGVDVRLRRYGSQTDCDTLLRHGGAEGLVTDAYRADYLKGKGLSLVTVAKTPLYWQLIANRMARINEIKQLSDKMVAIAPYSACEHWADLAIDSGKPKEAVYRVEVNDVSIRLRMLLNNEMDAVMLPEPQATTARLYQNPVLMDSRGKHRYPGIVAFRAKVYANAQRRKQIALFVKAYNQAVDSINIRGVKHYSSIIKKYMGADARTVNALPAWHFDHAVAPDQSSHH